MNRKPHVLREWIAHLQASGRYTFTRDEAVRDGGVAERKALWRAQRAGRLIQPRNGFFVIVPAEYRVAGAPPPAWFIDDLMRHRKTPYYIGLLSAAALYGASAQAAQEFQVVTPHVIRPIKSGRLRIRFVMRADLALAATAPHQTPTGRMRVSTIEQTALDLVAYPHVAGGWDNVASIIAEMAPRFDAKQLGRLSDRQGHVRDVQRLGYLLELVRSDEAARSLAKWLEPRAHGYVAFEPRGPRDAPRSDRWHLILNRRFELE